MKTRKFVMLMASVGLIFGMMTGCGGGGSDDGDGGGVVTGLEQEKVNDFVGDISNELGCTYTEIATSQSKQLNTTLSLDTVGLIKKVIVSGKNVKDVAAATISGTEVGTCGGSVTMPDDFLTTLTGTITFANFCMTAEEIGSQTTINGSVTLAVNEAAGTITASTPTPLTIVSSSPETGNPVNVTIDLDSGILTINEDGSIRITITALTVTDNVAGDVYTLTNFTADMDSDGNINFNGTFDPGTDTGALSVVGSFNGTTGVATLTATDQDGVKVTISSTDLEGGIFDVSFDNAPLGTMDCSDVNVTIPEL